MPKRKSKSTARANRDTKPARALPSSGDGPAGWSVAIALAFVIGIVYWPAVETPFIFDDFGAISGNDSITALWPLVGFTRAGPLNPPLEMPTSGRPLVNLSFAINYHFGGLNPAGYHAVNLLLHYLAAILLWAITRRTLRLSYFSGEFDRSAGWLALVVALLWALHPLQTEAVIYVTQRTELMMATSYLATLYCSLRYWSYLPAPSGVGQGASERVPQQDAQNRWLVLAILACICGMASKEVMVSAPLMVLLFERAFIAGSLPKALQRSWPLYVGLASTWILLLALVVGAPHRDAAGFGLGVSGFAWWLTQAKVFLMYLKLVAWPWPLLIHYQCPYLTSLADAWMYVVPVMVLGLVTLVLLWRHTPLGFLGSSVFAILSPTLLIPIVTEMAAERRMYLALAPLIAIAVVGGYRLAVAMLYPRAADVSHVPASRATAVVMGLPIVLLTLAFCFVSATRVVVYENEMGLWLEVLKWQPTDYMARQSIGSYLARGGEDAAAIEQYREAIKLNPDASLSHYSLALLLSKQGAYEEAASHFGEAARIIPKSAVLKNNLAHALYLAGRNDEAIDAFRAALALDPKYWPAHKNLGTALQKAGRYRESIQSFETALQLNPKAIEIYNDLANSYLRMDQRPTAIALLQQGLDLARAAGDTENAKRFAALLESQL